MCERKTKLVSVLCSILMQSGSTTFSRHDSQISQYYGEFSQLYRLLYCYKLAEHSYSFTNRVITKGYLSNAICLGRLLSANCMLMLQSHW